MYISSRHPVSSHQSTRRTGEHWVIKLSAQENTGSSSSAHGRTLGGSSSSAHGTRHGRYSGAREGHSGAREGHSGAREGPFRLPGVACNQGGTEAHGKAHMGRFEAHGQYHQGRREAHREVGQGRREAHGTTQEPKPRACPTPTNDRRPWPGSSQVPSLLHQRVSEFSQGVAMRPSVLTGLGNYHYISNSQ